MINKYNFNLTEKQLHYAIELLKIIGYSDENDIYQLLKLYEDKHSRTEVSVSTKSIKNRRGQHFRSIDVYNKKIVNYSIEWLKKEIEMKFEVDKVETKNINFEKYISATDLASFIFCNASYSISNSFIIKYLKNSVYLEEGIELHQEVRLFFRKNYFDFKGENIWNFSDHQKTFLNKIKSCKLLYKGHDNENHFFINEEKKYVGQPDYIFLDPNNNVFVVEEKYHRINSNNATKFSENIKYKSKDFYSNYIIQLQSYIDYIKEYDIKYGVLINWYYYVTNIDEQKSIKVYDFTFKIIKKNQESQLLEKTLNDVRNFNINRTTYFDKNVNFNKCMNCSVSYYCSHKTKNKITVELPYNR